MQAQTKETRGQITDEPRPAELARTQPRAVRALNYVIQTKLFAEDEPSNAYARRGSVSSDPAEVLTQILDRSTSSGLTRPNEAQQKIKKEKEEKKQLTIAELNQAFEDERSARVKRRKEDRKEELPMGKRKTEDN